MTNTDSSEHVEPLVTETEFGGEPRICIRTDRWGSGVMFSVENAMIIYQQLGDILGAPKNDTYVREIQHD